MLRAGAAFVALVLTAFVTLLALHGGRERGTLVVTATVGPTCPVARPGESCADAPFTGALTVRGRSGAGETRGLAVRAGHGRIALPSGRYVLTTATGVPPTLRPVPVSIRGHATTRVTLRVDSGIR